MNHARTHGPWQSHAPNPNHWSCTLDQTRCSPRIQWQLRYSNFGPFVSVPIETAEVVDLLITCPGVCWLQIALAASALATAHGGQVSTMVSFHCHGCPDATFKAHLHAAPCSADGGGHYNGGDGVTIDAINENWPAVTCANGRCSGMASNQWAPAADDVAVSTVRG